MKMLRVKTIDNGEIYVNPNHIVFLREGMYNGTKVIIEGMNVINSVDSIASVLLDLEGLNYD